MSRDDRAMGCSSQSTHGSDEEACLAAHDDALDEEPHDGLIEGQAESMDADFDTYEE
jgi:hypothetical protein